MGMVEPAGVPEQPLNPEQVDAAGKELLGQLRRIIAGNRQLSRRAVTAFVDPWDHARVYTGEGGIDDDVVVKFPGKDSNEGVVQYHISGGTDVVSLTFDLGQRQCIRIGVINDTSPLPNHPSTVRVAQDILTEAEQRLVEPPLNARVVVQTDPKFPH